MNRKDWEAQVFASDMNQTARLVAVVVGSFGNWNEERNVWPSTTAIADMAGINRDTAAKYIDAMVDQQMLEVVRVRPQNIKEYRLVKVVAEPVGILAKPKRAATDSQLSNLSTTGTEAASRSVVDTTDNQLPTRQVPVADRIDTNIKEPTIEPKEEQEQPERSDGIERPDDQPTTSLIPTTDPPVLIDPEGPTDVDDSASAPSSTRVLQGSIDEWEEFFEDHPELEKPA